MKTLFWIRRTKFITFVIFIILTLSVMLLNGCVSKENTTNVKSNTLYIGMTNAPDSFNPILNPGTAGRFAIRFMYDTLLGMPEPNKFTPQLAESIETQDNQNFVIKLNPKAKWTDGKSITADDVVYTFNLIANPNVESNKGTYIKMLEGVNDKGKLKSEMDKIPDLIAVNEHTVTLKTKTPVDPNYLKSMLGFEVYIVPKHVFEKIQPSSISNSEAVVKPTVTSGAFKFVTYVTNDHVEYVANKDYYKGTPKLERIFIRVMNGTNLVTELKSGNIQMVAAGSIGVIPIKDLDILKKDNKLTVKVAPILDEQYLIVNNSKFNTKFRQAITMAINRQQIVDQLYKGTAELVPTIYSKQSPVYDQNIKTLPYNPDRAKKLLLESGVDTSKEIVLEVPVGNLLREQSADLIQQDLVAIGLKVKQDKVDFPTILDKGRKGDYEMLMMGYVPTVDPDYSVYFTPTSPTNFSQTNDPKLLDMMTKAANMTSTDERKSAYSEIQKYMKEQQFLTVLYSPDQIIVQSKKLEGGIKDFWEGSLDDIYKWSFEN